MTDFFRYVVGEVKSGRLSNAEAIQLFRQIPRHVDSGDSSAGMLHPLLHENTSNLREQRFTTRFTGREFFLSDHVVKGQAILPGVAYLEMARAALELAHTPLNDAVLCLKNIVWLRPIVVA